MATLTVVSTIAQVRKGKPILDGIAVETGTRKRLNTKNSMTALTNEPTKLPATVCQDSGRTCIGRRRAPLQVMAVSTDIPRFRTQLFVER